MTGGQDEPGDDEIEAFVSDLRRVVADASVDEAVLARQRERGLRQQAEELATFTGLLLDLAERRTPIVARTSSGRPYRGRLEAVTQDCCVLRDARRITLLPLSSLSFVRRVQAPGARDSTGDRGWPADAPWTRAGGATGHRNAVAVSFGALLASLAGDRPRVEIVCAGAGPPLTGELRAVGADVLTIWLDADPPAPAYVSLSSVTEISVFGSG